MKNIAQASSPGTRYSRLRAFTIVELLVALMVSSIILTAIVTLSYAMSSAYNSTSDMNEKEAHIRYATMRISDLIKYSRLVCKATSDEFVIWRMDDNNDNQINISELTYIETGGGIYLRLLEFDPSPSDDRTYLLSTIQNINLKNWFISKYPETYTTLISDCSNMEIQREPDPPYTQLVNISFDIEENGQIRKCQISTALRCSMSSFINVNSNDDDL